MESGPLQALHLPVCGVLRAPESSAHSARLRLVESTELIVRLSCGCQQLLRLDRRILCGVPWKGLELLHKIIQLALRHVALLGEGLLLLSLELIRRVPGGGLAHDIR